MTRTLVPAGRRISWLLLVAATACAGRAPVRQVAQHRPLPASSPHARVLELKKLLIRIPDGAPIGALETGWGCFGLRRLSSETGKELLVAGELSDVFREVADAAGYAVPAGEDEIFGQAIEVKPDFLIGGTIRTVRANVCSPRLGLSPGPVAKGEASLAIDWQIYSNRSQRVELALTTEGSAAVSNARRGGAIELFQAAFRSAMRNLLADSAFHELVSGTERSRPAPPRDLIRISLPAVRAVGSVEAMLSESRLSVVTVFAGEKLGSGFLISSDGWVLTDEHVVSRSRYVKVRFVTGREAAGEVVRADRARDVALVKLEEDVYRPLPLGDTSRIRPGTEVYAIGTPLTEELGQTVTRGIVSGYGEDEGQRVIRSDVGIHRGNSGGPLLTGSGQVVGIAVGGMILPQGVGVGLNSFIPIEDAVRALGIESPRSGRGDDLTGRSTTGAGASEFRRD